MKPFNHGKSWTSQETIELKSLHKKLTIEELETHFGRSKNSVIYKIKELESQKKNSKSKKLKSKKPSKNKKEFKLESFVLDENFSKEVVNQLNSFKIKNEKILKDSYCKNGDVYVLLLDKRKFYVGYTTQTKNRINKHLNRKITTSWTKKYTPVRLLYLLENVDPEVEGWITGFLMRKFGFNNVRGYSYTRSSLYDTPPVFIDNLPIIID